jgi:uncharacterized membrane protein
MRSEKGTIGTNRLGALWAVLVLLLLAAAALLHAKAWGVDSEGYDIYYAWLEGQRLLAGENPYARVLEGNMVENDKYATYFPLFYLLSALSQQLGLRAYEAWIAFWQPVFMLFHLATGAWLAVLYGRRRQFLLGTAVLAIWLGGNWVLDYHYLVNQDAIPIFFFVVSLTLFSRHPWLALLSLSLSLAFKQIAIFHAPLYLIWLWQDTRERRPAKVLAGAAVIASVPLLISIPFLVWEAEGYLRSVVFSSTRGPSQELTAGLPLGWGGLRMRLPLFAVLGIVYLLGWLRRYGRYTVAMLVMLAFIALNPVFFPQYLPWFLALLLLALLEWGSSGDAVESVPTATKA